MSKTILNTKRIFYVRNKHIEKSKTFKKYIGKSVVFYVEILYFRFQNAINTPYNLYYDYWDLITKFRPGNT